MGPTGEVGERKQVTVLFSDLTGYTALSERLDPLGACLAAYDVHCAIRWAKPSKVFRTSGFMISCQNDTRSLVTALGKLPMESHRVTIKSKFMKVEELKRLYHQLYTGDADSQKETLNRLDEILSTFKTEPTTALKPGKQ